MNCKGGIKGLLPRWITHILTYIKILVLNAPIHPGEMSPISPCLQPKFLHNSEVCDVVHEMIRNPSISLATQYLNCRVTEPEVESVRHYKSLFERELRIQLPAKKLFQSRVDPNAVTVWDMRTQGFLRVVSDSGIRLGSVM